MTENTYRKNYRKLVAQVNRTLREYGEAALKSKAFALEEETAPFTLPNNVLRAALIHAQDVCKGAPSEENRKQVANIYIMTYPTQ